MKLTAQQLRSIIKEEKEALEEYGADGQPVYSASAVELLNNALLAAEQAIGHEGVQDVLRSSGYLG